MPAHDGVRPHDDQCGAPIPPRVGEQDPRQSISGPELWTLGSASEHRQLLTQREVLKHVIVFNESHLRRTLAGYLAYYNDVSYCPTSLCA